MILTKRERVAGRIPFDFQKVVELSPTGLPAGPAAMPRNSAIGDGHVER